MRRALALAALIALAGCAHGGAARAPAAPAPETAVAAEPPAPAVEDAAAADDLAEDDLALEAGPRVADPLAPWNRTMFAFNDKLYFWALKPAARAYRAVVPRIARKGVENFFHNLATPVRFVSDLLQLKGGAAAMELGTFMLNTTWGGLGFGNLFEGDPRAKTPDADLGLALARHGVGNGIYIVWPFIGPSTLRDSVGRVGDWFLDPISYVDPLEASLGVRSYSEVNSVSFRIGDYESLKDASIDPYLAVRDAYLQHRAKKAKE